MNTKNDQSKPKDDNQIVMVFPGSITMEDLKQQLENSEFVPMWKMHPVVQHVLRCFASSRPGRMQQISSDDNDWKDFAIRPYAMLCEAYRLRPGAFDERFVQECTHFKTWATDHKKKARQVAH